MTDLPRRLMDAAGANGARSTVLHPLQWVIGLLGATMASSLAAHASNWVIIVLIVYLGFVVAQLLVIHGVMCFKNIEALRSEPFILEDRKLALGDTKSGFPPKARRSTKAASGNKVIE